MAPRVSTSGAGERAGKTVLVGHRLRPGDARPHSQPAWSSRSSLTPGLQKNADGSVDVYFGSEAPASKESNWVPTKNGGEFEVLFRFYGPDKTLFEKKWKLPNIEK
jgi:hypothetical protein